jgi:tetratricopeptide (TPR) repeat protein
MKKLDYLIELDKLIKKKKYKDSEIFIFNILKDYEDSFIYYYLGYAQIMLNKIEQGIDNLKRSVFLDQQKKISYPRLLLSKIYFQNEKYEICEKYLKEALSINQDRESLTLLIQALVNLNKKDEALIEYDNLCKKFPKSLKSKEVKNLKDKILNL